MFNNKTSGSAEQASHFSPGASKLRQVYGAAQWAGTKYRNRDGSFRQEDSHYVSPDGRLAMVADGIGGNGAGEVASRILADVFQERYKNLPENISYEQAEQWLKETIEAASQTVVEAQKREIYLAGDGTMMTARAQMGSTVVACLRMPEKMLIAWAGDSRAYRLRGGKLEQLTRDHSLENELVDKHLLSEGQAKEKEIGHIIVSAVGRQLKISQIAVDLAFGDRYLLATDGLEVLEIAEIETLLTKAIRPSQAASSLIQAVKDKQTNIIDAQDNTTVVVIAPVVDPIIASPAITSRAAISSQACDSRSQNFSQRVAAQSSSCPEQAENQQMGFRGWPLYSAQDTVKSWF
ncbi:MAG: protein phosphatase 2C domain-containing protein [Candidatus Obscuribacter sp.]|nr:protein phosphatase 2C domain-containing protein [Candidatus Obscuribacter sp.]